MSTRFLHLEVMDGHITAAIQEDDTSGDLRVGVSFCSPKDQFSRKRGRIISEGRLKKGKLFLNLNAGGRKDTKELVRQVLREQIEAKDERYPLWIKQQ